MMNAGQKKSTSSSSSSSGVQLPPRDPEEMVRQAIAAVKRAASDGKTKTIVRLLIPRENQLVAPDESFEGGIMQLYGRVAPMARDIVRGVVGDIGGVAPKMQEQRLDESGVDGESVWFAEGATPKDDVIALVQPSQERRKDILNFADQAKMRPMILVNPQWKDIDDPLDFLSKQEGIIGSIGNFLGGKGGLVAELEERGFIDVFRFDEFQCRGSRICLSLAYPNGWTMFYFDNVKGTFVPLATNLPTRPTYDEVGQLLIDNNVPFKFNEFQEVL